MDVPYDFSVSKINQIVSLLVIFLWIGLVIKVLPPFNKNSPIVPEYAITIGVAIIAALVIYIMGRTDKNDYKNLTATKRKTTLKPEFTREQNNTEAGSANNRLHEDRSQTRGL